MSEVETAPAAQAPQEASSCCSSSSCCGPSAATVTRDAPKVGRNDPCPCGNGMKFKKCCGR